MSPKPDGILWSPGKGRGGAVSAQWFYRERLEGRTYPAGAVYREIRFSGEVKSVKGKVATIRP